MATTPATSIELIDLHLALWYADAVRRRLEREGLTPGVRQAFAEARRELDRALDGLGIDRAAEPVLCSPEASA